MTYTDWIEARGALRTELEIAYKRTDADGRARTSAEIDAALAVVTDKEHALLARATRWYALSSRGCVIVAHAFLDRPPQVYVKIKDESRLQETTFEVTDAGTDDGGRLTNEEKFQAGVARVIVNQWISGMRDTLPPGLTRDEAHAPWR